MLSNNRFMDKKILKNIAEQLKNFPLNEEFRIMEICGTHTAEFFKTGVKDIFPDGLILIDGPGCPVCVTPNSYLDRAIEIAKVHNTIITTFGDMIKVPSSYSSLRNEISDGMDVRIVYSPMNCLEIAEQNPDKEIIFLSIGFETTAPAEAVAVIEAKKRNIKNFSILPGNKLTPPAVEALINAEEVKIDGFIIPGNVSAVTGADIWKFIPDKYSKPSVIAGFETGDLIRGVLTLLELLIHRKNELKNEYKVIVKKEGNKRALEIMNKVFMKTDSEWRGLGSIPESGLSIKNEFEEYDSKKKFPVKPPVPKEHPGCRCGDLLRGLITPPECPLFGKGCSPENAIGPCMVSSEGPCAAYFKYWSK